MVKKNPPNIFELAFKAEAIHNMTDKELADLIMKEVWPQTNALSHESTIISSVIDRLQRSNAGALPPLPDSDEDLEEIP